MHYGGTFSALVVLGALACVVQSAEAAEPERGLTAVRTVAAPRIDGVLDDAIWSEGEAADSFTQSEPREGRRAAQPTRVKVAYDSSNIYVAAWLQDSDPEDIVALVTRRDRDTESDSFGVIFDGYHDHRTARFFMVNAAGVQRDGAIARDSVMDFAWDGVWSAAVHVDDRGWTAELRIPLRELRFSADAEKSSWGFNATRYVPRAKERSWWAPVSRTSGQLVSSAGHLTGVEQGKREPAAVLIPYVAAALELSTTPSGETASVLEPRYGIDLQRGLGGSFTLDAAVNPDFGQVEVDRAVVNLTAFETFYPEKRPFFLERSDLFHNEGSLGEEVEEGTRIFYSRRIGQLYRQDVVAPEGARVVANPSNAPILGAAKVTGRTEGGLSVGLLEVLTDETVMRMALDSGEVREAVTSPRTNFAVGRLRYEPGKRSHIGVIATAATRVGDAPDAYVVATDGRYRSKNGKFRLSGITAGSVIAVDGETRVGGAAHLSAAKEGGDHFVAEIGYDVAGADFDVNDLGYVQTTNEHAGYAGVELRSLEGTGAVRELRAKLSLWTGYLITPHVREYLGGVVAADVALRNFWSASVGMDVETEGFDAYEARAPGRLYLRPTSVAPFVSLASDERQPVSGRIDAEGAQDGLGATRVALGTTLNVRIGNRVEMALGARYGRRTAEHGWAANVDGVDAEGFSVFGRRDVEEVEVWTQGTVAPRKNLSLQFFIQLLHGGVRYSELLRLNPDGSLSALAGPTVGEDDLDHGGQYVNANLVLRWEFRPGSTLYAVWLQTRANSFTTPPATVRQELRGTLRGGHFNAFTVKVSYRWP